MVHYCIAIKNQEHKHLKEKCSLNIKKVIKIVYYVISILFKT